MALLMTGMTGYICNDCVEQAHNILREEALLPKSDFEMKELPKPKDIKAFLDEYVMQQRPLQRTTHTIDKNIPKRKTFFLPTDFINANY